MHRNTKYSKENKTYWWQKLKLTTRSYRFELYLLSLIIHDFGYMQLGCDWYCCYSELISDTQIAAWICQKNENLIKILYYYFDISLFWSEENDTLNKLTSSALQSATFSLIRVWGFGQFILLINTNSILNTYRHWGVSIHAECFIKYWEKQILFCMEVRLGEKQ